MKRWVAERGVNDPNIWRDEDVAMASESHILPDRDSARTMLVGMIATEGFSEWSEPTAVGRRTAFLELAEQVASGRKERVELPWNKVFYQIRPL